MQHRRRERPQLANLSLGQKFMAFLSLIVVAVVGFFTASVMLSIVAIIFCIAAVVLAVRWVWCKITGKPFIPGMRVDFTNQGGGQFYRGRPGGGSNGNNNGPRSSNNDTIDAEFHEVADNPSNLEDSHK